MSDQIESAIRDIAAVLKKHRCVLCSPDGRNTLMLAYITDPGTMQDCRTLAAFSYITPRSAEYMPRDSAIAIRWSDNSIGTRELETENRKSIIEHI